MENNEIVNITYEGIEEKPQLNDLINKVLYECFKEEKLLGLNIYIAITLTTPSKIHELNKKFRDVDRETDVLSFPMFEKNEIDEIIKKGEKLPEEDTLGDVVISVDRVKEQAIEYGHSFERELSYMLVHGFYHLMGYDHIKEEDKKVMRKKEETILNRLGITRD